MNNISKTEEMLIMILFSPFFAMVLLPGLFVRLIYIALVTGLTILALLINTITYPWTTAEERKANLLLAINTLGCSS